MRRGGGPLRDAAGARHGPPLVRHAWRVLAPAAGVLAALLATGAGWPGSPHPAAPQPSAAQASAAQPSAAQASASRSVAAQATPSGASPASSWLLSRSAPATMPAPAARSARPRVAPLRHLLSPDLVAVSARPLPARSLAAIRHLHGVHAAQAVDAAQIQVNGKFVAVLGVNPSQFRGFAAKPTARDTKFWRSVAAGDLGLSYTMGKQDKLPAGSSVTVAGRHVETMPVGPLGTVGIGGIDAVVSDTAAESLGFPRQNAVVINATAKTSFSALAKRIKKVLPHSAAVDQVALQPGQPGASVGPVPSSPPQTSVNGLVTLSQVREMLAAAVSRVGMPYVWGAAGPRAFDCSGLVQWSFRQAGIVMPRVAADQARTGPAVAVKDLQPGDLLFYHTDPTAPNYISHVAIYLGNGRMIQAPEPGMNVEIVPVDTGAGFAGAVEVSPRIAAEAAATTV